LQRTGIVAITTHGAKTSVPYAGIRGRNESAAHRCLSGSHDQEKHMNRFANLFKPLMWSMAILLAAFVAGCGGDDGFSNGTDAKSGAGPGAVCAAAGCVPLGMAANYAILAKTGVDTVPSSVVTGNVGLSPAARVGLTGWSLITEPADASFTSAQVVAPGKLFAADNAPPTPTNLTAAVNNMQTAYTNAAGRTASSAATTNVLGGTLTSLTINAVPGGVTVYEWGTAVTIPTDLTFNGSATDVFILKVAGTLDMTAAKNVILTGGALPQNIFWQVSGAVTIGANVNFKGIILGQTAITFGNLASINGRLLAQSAVNLGATTVTRP
jgi:hypothetical protein